MTILLIGDAHIKATNLETGKQFLNWLVTLAETHRPEMVVNLGDFFDGHSVLRAEILSEYRRFVDAITAMNIPYYHVLGNHEMFKPNDATYHALQSMKGLNPLFHVVDEVLTVGDYTFVPYCVKTESFPLETTPIVFAHQTFTGADFGHGFRPDNGVDADTVSAELIVSGHIHHRQDVGKVFYPGSPLSNGADDVDQIKGVFLLDPTTYKTTFIESPFPRWRSMTALILDMSTLQWMKDQVASAAANIKWILNIKGPRAETNAFLESASFKELRDMATIRVRAEYTDLESTRVKIDAVSAESAVNQWIDMVYDGTLEKDALKVAAKKMMQK